MKEIEVEIKKLLKILDSISKTHEDFVNSQINNMINECTGVESNSKDDEYDKVDYLGDDFKLLIALKGNQKVHKFQKNLVSQYRTILDIVINLNKILDTPIKKVQRIEEIKQKLMLSVADVELVFSFSKTQQQNLRGRLKNPLPSHKASTKSKSSNTKIYYKIQEINEWIDNYY